jgi:hypothetical protein
MKKLSINNYLALLLGCLLLLSGNTLIAQEEKTEEAPVPEKIIRLRYFAQDNNLQYLLVESLTKTGKKMDPRANANIKIYLDSAGEGSLIAGLNTGASGKAKAIIPPAMKANWDASPTHSFIAVEAPAGKEEEERSTTLDISKAKLTIDTSSDETVKSITVTATKYQDGAWVPAPEVEMKVGIERLGGLLTAGTDDTYTTDSSGVVTVEFSKNNLPGNEKGEIVLAARVDDNEYYGNLLVKKTVPWGIAKVASNAFANRRTLWSTSDKAPYWLMLLAYTIMASVWGVLIYLVYQIYKIRKLGKQAGEKSLLIKKEEAELAG